MASTKSIMRLLIKRLNFRLVTARVRGFGIVGTMPVSHDRSFEEYWEYIPTNCTKLLRARKFTAVEYEINVLALYEDLTHIHVEIKLQRRHKNSYVEYLKRQKIMGSAPIEMFHYVDRYYKDPFFP